MRHFLGQLTHLGRAARIFLLAAVFVINSAGANALDGESATTANLPPPTFFEWVVGWFDSPASRLAVALSDMAGLAGILGISLYLWKRPSRRSRSNHDEPQPVHSSGEKRDDASSELVARQVHVEVQRQETRLKALQKLIGYEPGSESEVPIQLDIISAINVIGARISALEKAVEARARPSDNISAEANGAGSGADPYVKQETKRNPDPDPFAGLSVRQVVGICFAYYCRQTASFQNERSAFEESLRKRFPDAVVTLLYLKTGAPVLIFKDQKDGSSYTYWKARIGSEEFLFPTPINKDRFSCETGFVSTTSESPPPEAVRFSIPALIVASDIGWEIEEVGQISATVPPEFKNAPDWTQYFAPTPSTGVAPAAVAPSETQQDNVSVQNQLPEPQPPKEVSMAAVVGGQFLGWFESLKKGDVIDCVKFNVALQNCDAPATKNVTAMEVEMIKHKNRLVLKKVRPTDKSGLGPGNLFWLVSVGDSEPLALPAPSEAGRLHISRAVQLPPNWPSNLDSIQPTRISKITPAIAKPDTQDPDLWILDDRKIGIELKD